MALPIPKDGESLSDYLKNEIRAKIDTLYPEFKDKNDNDIIKMLQEDDKYKTVREHPNFIKMMEEAGSAQQEVSQKNEISATDNIIEAKSEKKKEKEDPEEEVAKEAKDMTSKVVPSAVEVAAPEKEEGSEEKVQEEPEAISQTKAASTSANAGRTRIEWLNQTFDIATTVSTKKTECGLFFIQQDGIIDHLHSLKLGNIERRKMSKIVHWAGQFVMPGRINPISVKMGSGEKSYFINPAHHVVSQSDPILDGLHGTAQRRLDEREAEVRLPNNAYTAAIMGMQYDGVDMLNNDAYCLDLSLENRSDGGFDNIVCARYIQSKTALTMMLQRQNAYKFCFPKGNEEFLDDHRDFIHEDIVSRVKSNMLLDKDQVYKDRLKRTRYGRTYLPGDENRFMLEAPTYERLLYTDMLKKSYAAAKTNFSSIRETQTEHKFSNTGHELMSSLLQVSAADGSKFAQEYFAYLCGGRGHALAIANEQGRDDNLIFPLACYATLLMVPMYLFDHIEVRTMIAGILQPFSYTTDSLEAGGREILGNMSMASAIIRKDAANNVIGLIPTGQIQALLNANLHGTTFDKIRGAQRRVAKTNAIEYLLNVFRHISNTEMTAMQGLPQLFSFSGRDERVFYLPFMYDNRVPEYILFKKHMHGARDYTAAAIGLRNKLSELVKALANIDPIIERGISTFLSTYVSQQSVFRTATSLATATLHTVLAVQDPHIMPAVNALRVGENRANAVDLATIDIMGALSFIMHGIESDQLQVSRDSTSEAYKFISYNFELQIPDAYGPYLYLERALARHIYIQFQNDKVMYLERDLLVRACMHVLSLWFTRLDTGTEDRLTTMFNESETYLDFGDYPIPEELMIGRGAVDAVARVEAVAIKPYSVTIDNDIATPYGLKVFSINEVGIPTQVYPSVNFEGNIFTDEIEETQVEQSYRCGEQKIRDFYISIDHPLQSYIFIDSDRVNTKLYMIDEEHFQECQDNDDALDPNTPVEDKKIITYDEFMEIFATYRTKDVYTSSDVREMILARRKRGQLIQAEYVVVRKSYCNFSFIEETTDFDTFMTMPNIEVKLDDYLATDKKYIVGGTVPVYYRKCKENYLTVTATGELLPGTVVENENFLPFYGFKLRNFMSLIATFGDLDMDVNMRQMFGNERKFKILNGLGAEICSDDMVISTRSEEEVVIQSSLPLYPMMP